MSIAPTIRNVLSPFNSSQSALITITGNNFGITANMNVTFGGQICGAISITIPGHQIMCIISGNYGNQVPIVLYADGQYSNSWNYTFGIISSGSKFSHHFQLIFSRYYSPQSSDYNWILCFSDRYKPSLLSQWFFSSS